MGIRCVLLDVDGTLVDSNDAHAHAWEDALPEAGFDLPEGGVRRLECEAAETVMIGDTPYDVEAAARARVPAIAFRCGGWDDASLRGAIAIYDGAAGLLDRWDASPLAGGTP